VCFFISLIRVYLFCIGGQRYFHVGFAVVGCNHDYLFFDVIRSVGRCEYHSDEKDQGIGVFASMLVAPQQPGWLGVSEEARCTWTMRGYEC